MWMTNEWWTTPVSNLKAGLNPEPSLVHDHKEVLDRTMCITTTDFKGILDQIVKSWEQWIVQLLKGHEDLKMIGEIGLVNHQEIEMVIPEWWMWWRWLVHSLTAWKASHEGLKALTPVPNPIRKSPQMQVTCGWKRVLMHKHYNMSMHQYFLCFVTVFDYLLIDYVGGFLFVYLCILLFIFVFDQSFSSYVSKIQKSHKKKIENQKVWLTLLSFVSKLVLPCTFVLMALCIVEHSLFHCTLITMGEILKSMWLL